MSNTESSDTKITFKVENIQSAKAFPSIGNFFTEELDQVKLLIKKLLEDIGKLDESNTSQKETKGDNHFHQHNSISVLGARGMGKTSFMLSLRDVVESEFKEKVIWLPNLDPARMEENETFLVTVVANILTKIKDKQQGDLSQDIRDKLQVLARDFAVLAPQQVHLEQWKDLVGDPDSFAYEVLNKAHSGLSLAHSFHEFIGTCLKFYDGKKAFIQPIDDVDSAISQGWPILETVRRYLATPCMITIISGDIDLFTILIKNQQFDKIKHLPANEDAGKLKKHVDQLTEQYLSKVMPYHLRVRLMPLTHKIMERATRNIEFISLEFNNKSGEKKPNKALPLSKIYRNFISDLFNFPSPKPDVAETAILKPEFAYVRFLPNNLRDLIQLFKVFEYWQEGIPQRGDREKALQGLSQIFEVTLYSGNITIDDLLLLRKGRHTEWLSNYCLDTREHLQQFWRLHPQYDDEEWNQRAVLLQAFLFQGWKARSESKKLLYPQGPMSFAIKVLLPCWIAASYDLTGEGLTQLKRLLGIGNTERHVYMGIRSLAYKLRDDQENWSKCGSGYVRIHNSDDPKEKVVINWNNPLGWFCRRIFRSNNGLALYADMLLAVARLVDVLKEGHDLSKDPSVAENQLKNLFNLFIQDRIWEIHPEFRGNCDNVFSKIANKLEFDIKYSKSMFSKLPETYKDGHVIIKSTLSLKQAKGLFRLSKKSNLYTNFENDFVTKILGWIEKMKNFESKHLLPPPIIARFWVRFMSNLDYISTDIETNSFPKEINDDDKKLRHIIKCWVSAFLHALWIEEVIFLKGDREHGIPVEHILLSDADDKTFRELKGKNGSTPYSNVWENCPLFQHFLE